MSKVEFDPKKNEINLAKHGISLARAAEFQPLLVKFDHRFEYGERRMLAFGFIDSVAHCLCFVERSGVVRAISLRRAHEKELKRHVEENEKSH